MLQLVLLVETALMLGLIGLLSSLTSSQSSYFRLYELFGALSASIITTYGIYKMRQLT